MWFFPKAVPMSNIMKMLTCPAENYIYPLKTGKQNKPTTWVLLFLKRVATDGSFLMVKHNQYYIYIYTHLTKCGCKIVFQNCMTMCGVSVSLCFCVCVCAWERVSNSRFHCLYPSVNLLHPSIHWYSLVIPQYSRILSGFQCWLIPSKYTVRVLGKAFIFLGTKSIFWWMSLGILMLPEVRTDGVKDRGISLDTSQWKSVGSTCWRKTQNNDRRVFSGLSVHGSCSSNYKYIYIYIPCV